MGTENKARSDIEKLSILLPHWLHHNNDHIMDQENWLKKAEAAGLKKVAHELRRALELQIQANRHFEMAGEYLRNMKR